ncbi:MAG: hypothetical protein A2270_06450 [Elusimicrobia bacterium RIFOXYA12_FULL_51_18]|nr:MAG: hypothetical protein A2270_06450 [Elusimicrobia bacterium RIFOXYA12_FULL_51_18]OGS29425.1 MAG: hypothetical protein A2218_00270 [Elusimicrobia bacterium RIFOXYA2_FULL_53_38]
MLTPSEQLKNVAASYVRITSYGKHTNHTALQVPDERIQLIFDFKTSDIENAVMVEGIRHTYGFLRRTGVLEQLKIKMRPGIFYSLFQRPAHFFTDRSMPLKAAIGQKASYFDTVFTAKTHTARLIIIERILKKLAQESPSIDSKVQQIVESIYISNGNISGSELCKQVGMGYRQFHDLFNKWIGASFKIFCNIVKFHQTRLDLRHLHGQSITAIALKNGYRDQAHLTSDFKKFHGLTPLQVRNRYASLFTTVLITPTTKKITIYHPD